MIEDARAPDRENFEFLDDTVLPDPTARESSTSRTTCRCTTEQKLSFDQVFYAKATGRPRRSVGR